MDFHQFLQTAAFAGFNQSHGRSGLTGPVDIGRAAAIEVNKDLYLEAEARGLSLSELLELDEFDPTPSGCPLDAFERQLALAGIRLGGKSPTTVEQFFQQAPALMPEFMQREIRKGMAMRPELERLVANSTTVATNKYTPFFIDTSDNTKFSLRPVGEGAEVPQLLVTEQTNSVNVTDYGLALKASYKALRYRSTSQFRVLLWYIGFKIQTDKIGLLVDTIINGDGNNNAAAVINTATSGTLTYDDLINLWSQFSPFEMNTIICHVNQMKTILTLEEFKDPLAGYRFQQTGDLFSPLGATLVRSDEVTTDLVLGLDKRFAVEEVITQPLMVEYDKVIEQRFEEAVISESVTYAKVIKEASFVLDTVWV
ncbi:MAG: phage major capsid protein [Candidatus Zixiibacteriota bacterium]